MTRPDSLARELRIRLTGGGTMVVRIHDDGYTMRINTVRAVATIKGTRFADGYCGKVTCWTRGWATDSDRVAAAVCRALADDCSTFAGDLNARAERLEG